MSGLGKGITAASIGRILKNRSHSITAVKIDPYLNIDAGTMNPAQHGEVFVLSDGGEVDLDLGNYERFLDVDLTGAHNITTGKVYRTVIEKERRGDYLGETVQIIPHITEQIKACITHAAHEPLNNGEPAKICLVEVGGTVGDIESMPFLEAVRQMRSELPKEDTILVHLTLVPGDTMGELKTKPTQHSVKTLRELGLIADIIVGRTHRPIDAGIKKKISAFCDLPQKAVISATTVPDTYYVPMELEKEGINGIYDLSELRKTKGKRIVWLMLPAGDAMNDIALGKGGLISILTKGDIIIDGSNSFYEDTIKRARSMKKYGIDYLDVGVSGGPGGALHGASCMVGGDEEVFHRVEFLLHDISVAQGVAYLGKSGAGHFVKMVHNGIEYGMMQSIAEGFELLKKSDFHFNLTQIADIYNHGTVIESRLLHWLKKTYEEYGENLESVSSVVTMLGEGQWTVKTGEKLKVSTPSIKVAVDFRTKSLKKPSYSGKVLSALRRQFGGHKA